MNLAGSWIAGWVSFYQAILTDGCAMPIGNEPGKALSKGRNLHAFYRAF